MAASGRDTKAGEGDEHPVKRIILPLPPSVNHCYIRTPNGMALTQKARDWKLRAAWEAKTTLRGWRVADQKVVLEIWVFWADRRKRDLDNLGKLLCDSLQGIVYTNDRWALPRFMDWDIDNKNPRIEVIPRMMG